MNNVTRPVVPGYAAMAQWMSLSESIAALVHDGDCVALEGFTHLIPFAAGHEIIRQGRRHLSLVRMTRDLIYDQLIGAGCADRLTFSWGSNLGVGSLHRFRDAVERGWPAPLELEERSHSDLANACVAGASNLPFAVLRGYTGSSFEQVKSAHPLHYLSVQGGKLAATPSVRPDVTVIHAQKADRSGNVLLWGILGVQKNGTGGAPLDRYRGRTGGLAQRRAQCLRSAPLGCERRVPGSSWRNPFLRSRILRSGQCVLSTMGRYLTGP
jgi:acyl CoA:acetate/3-ketoacid CoA transferase alpha subunit